MAKAPAASLSAKNATKEVQFDGAQSYANSRGRRSAPYPPNESNFDHQDDVSSKESDRAQETPPSIRPEESPAFPPFNSAVPISSTGQPIFTHHTTPSYPGLATGNFTPFGQPPVQPALNHPSFTAPNPSFPCTPHPIPFNPTIMGDYANTGTHDQGVHFQPQVPDTSFGPHVHHYVPRPDNNVIFGQQYPMPNQAPAFYLQPGTVAVPIQQASGVPVPIVATPPAPVTPVLLQQPATRPVVMHPINMNGNIAQQPSPVAIPIQQPAPGFAANFAGMPVHPEPALGVGLGANDIFMQHAQVAQENNMFEPQDFKPADDDPSRIYMCRELDGNWTQRTRYTIDNIGCRWYLTDEGYFYAVRLPN